MRKSIVKNSLYNIIYKVITALYPLVAVTYVSHILQAERMGMVSYAQNIVSYFTIIAALGLPTYGIREIAKRADSIKERSDLFWELILVNAISTTLSCIVFIVLIFAIPKFHDNLTLYIVAGLQIFLNYINVDWFYQGMEEYKYISIRSIVVKIFALFSLPLLIHTSDDYIYYALIYCLAIAGNNVFNIIRLKRYIQKPSKRLNVMCHLKPVLILLIASIAVEIYAMVDTTMLGIFCDDSTVGCYSNAMKLTRMVNTMAAAIGGVLLPRLSVAFENKEMGKFNELVNSGIKIMLVIAIPASIGLILLSKEIILVFFGTSFEPAIPILRILALMVPIVVCNTLLGSQVLITTNMESKYVLSVTVASLFNVCLNSLFIPRFGAQSAAVASLISECIDLIFYLWFSRNYVRLKIQVRYVLSILIPLTVYILLSLLVIRPMNMGNMSTLLVNIIICILVYFGLGLLMKNEAMLFAYGKIKTIVNNKWMQHHKMY